VTLPELTPVTIPDREPTVAIEGLVLVHTPPSDVSIRCVVCPWHTTRLPSIGDIGLMTTGLTLTQPEPPPYEMITVPDAIPHTMPVDEPIVAMEGVALLHTPPDVASNNVAQPPTQTSVGPVIGDGIAKTVNGNEAEQPPTV